MSKVKLQITLCVLTLYVKIHVYINIHTSIGNMTVCDSNGVPYHMAECNLEYGMFPGELGQFNLWLGRGQGPLSRDFHACAIEAGE